MLIRLKGLNFEVGQAYVLPEHYPLLTKVMQAVRVLDAGKMVVEGHTDTTGTAAMNQVLSQERAEAVKSYIANNGGLDTKLISAIGFGPDKPIAAHTSHEGRRLNRRTDILISARKGTVHKPPLSHGPANPLLTCCARGGGLGCGRRLQH